ncbi:MAG: hypothetical protein SGJ13_02415 [Actinomycetota bacterium]|nr:hypothetical protein [Actinomycetota bacterium]
MSRELPLVAKLDELAVLHGETGGWAQLYTHPAHGNIEDAPGIFIEVFRSPALPKAIAQAMRNAEQRRPVPEGTLYLWPTTWSGADATMGALMTDSTLIVVRASDAFTEDNVVEFVSSLGIVWPDLRS